MAGSGGAAAVVATAGVVVALDQVTKQIADSRVGRGDAVDVFPGLEITNTRNTGVAFGAFEGAGLLVAVLIGISLLLLLAYFWRHRDTPWLWLPVGMLLGGALGNLADRAREGAVIDFIDPVAWPAFNVADSLHRDRCAGTAVGGGAGIEGLTADRGGRRPASRRVPGRARRRAVARGGAALDRSGSGDRGRACAAEEPPAVGRGGGARGRSGGRRTAGRPGARSPSRWSTRTTSCWWWTSPPAWSRIRRRATAGPRSPRPSRAGRRAATTPSARASCTGSTATRPA